MTTISMPLFVVMGIKKPKRVYFNLNNYRNWHYQVSNNAKVAYGKIMAPKVELLTFSRIKLDFVLHRGDRRHVDRSNILCIHEKFFCDGLTECGCITDDNDKFLESSHYYTGEIDKENPRVDIIITSV